MTFANRLLAASCLAAGLFALPALAEPVSIKLLQVNDWDRYEEDDGRGGFARLVTILAAEDAAADNVLLIHAGDAISPSLLSGFDRGAHMIALLNELPLDVFVMGNHEFDFGPEVAAERLAEAGFDVVNSNVRTAGGELFPGTIESKLVEIDGIKLGFYGLTTPDTIELASPGDTTFAPLVETASLMQAKLREAGADIVVAVVHAGWGEDMELYQARVADIIMTGHDHDLRAMYNGRMAMTESGSQADYATAIDLVAERDDEGKVTWRPAFRTIDSARVEPDAAALAELQPYEDKLSAELDVDIGEAMVELDTQRATVRTMESNFGDLIADAIRNATGADIGLTNGGGIRGNRLYEAGHVLTRRDVLSELPFGNTTVLVELSGADLMAALENGVSQVEEGAGRFPHVSGLRLTYDASRPAGARVTEVLVGDAPLDLAATYSLATNDYMLGGGDGYASLGKGKVLIDGSGGTLMANTVMNYITAMGGKVEQVADGRVTRLN
ncbi:MAG: bifunctional UDP-sugar hydrolase/5'-nucleotidase [Geminicoccaceae bacterium]